MSDAANAFRAGLVIVIGSAIALTFFLLSDKRMGERNTVAYHAFLTDAGGINAKSQITIAGLQVGQIDAVTLVPIKVGELVPDLEVRALDLMGFPPPSADVRIVAGGDFNDVISLLQSQGKLPTRDEVETRKLSKEDVLQRIAAVKGDLVRVARVDFVVNKDWPLPVDSWMRKGSLGLLGANALFLEPGSSMENLGEGERLVNVASQTEMNALMAQAKGIVGDIKSITRKIDEDIGGITGDIHGITTELNRFIAGDEDTQPLDEIYRLVMTDLRKLSNTVEGAIRDANALIRDNDEQFQKLIMNVQNITADIAELTGKGEPGTVGPDGGPAEGDLRATMASVRRVADDLSVVTNQLREVLGENEEEVGEGVRSLQTTIHELNRSLASLSEVAGRVERGEGTVGRLLSDEKIADKVEAAVAGASDYVTSLTSLEMHVDVGSWYNFYREGATTTLGLKLQPRPDKYYLFEIVNDDGRIERFTERDREGNFLRESIREEDNTIRISAMFAKQFFDFLVVRVGLIETSGGVGANVYLLDTRVELRSDVFNIGAPRNNLYTDADPADYLPRWRTLLKAQPIPHIYVSAGVDDVLNSVGPNGFQSYSERLGYGFDYFFGVGVTFKDDDLRTILPFLPGG